MPYICSGKVVSALRLRCHVTSTGTYGVPGGGRALAHSTEARDRDEEKRTHVQHETVRTRIPKHRRLRCACREQKHEDAGQERECRERELASAHRELARAARPIDEVTRNNRAGDAED